MKRTADDYETAASTVLLALFGGPTLGFAIGVCLAVLGDGSPEQSGFVVPLRGAAYGFLAALPIAYEAWFIVLDIRDRDRESTP